MDTVISGEKHASEGFARTGHHRSLAAMTPTSIEGVTGLARESALSLGHLIGQHVKVARLEIAAEVRTMGRRATAVAVLAALVAIGYALAIAGVAVVIGGGAELGIPLVVIGAAHVVGAGAGLVFGPLRARAAHLQLMGNTTAAIDRALEKVHAR